MYSILYFDTEDSVSPPECGADDIVLWMAQALTERRLTGSFHLIGDKVRKLAERDRRDIIDALRRHDTSSHYNHGSVHPNTTEEIAPVGWERGVEIALKNERPGFELIEQHFGRCAALTRHGGSFSPQAVHAAGLCGKAFYGVPFDLPGHRAFWFAGTLCFSILGLVIDPQTDGNGPGYLESIYHDDQAFEQKLRAFEPALQATAFRYAFTSLFGSHPHRMNTTEFSCWNYYGGINRAIPLPPPLRPPEEREKGRCNFLRFLDVLASHRETLKICGLSELATLFGRTPSAISAAQLRAYAARVRQSQDVPLHALFSPAELLVGLAESIVSWTASAQLPAKVGVSRVIGPTTMPAQTWQPQAMDQAGVVALAKQLLSFVRQHGRLPSDPAPALALSALAAAYDDIASGRVRDSWKATVRAPWPDIAQDWLPRVMKMAKWTVFPPDIDFSRIGELTCLQAWSAKPALAPGDISS